MGSRHSKGRISLMQSLLSFVGEVQTAKRRLLSNFEVSGDGTSSLKPNGDAQNCDTLKPIDPPKIHQCMKVQKLLRTECYRTRSVATKTESVRPNTHRVPRRSFLRRLGLLRDDSPGNSDQKSP
jgi:hypothetical protein